MVDLHRGLGRAVRAPVGLLAVATPVAVMIVVLFAPI
jgi:hypothetical protein